jgi:hypothetical protein
MNFLEQLANEWYSYTDHFVRNNIKFDKRPNGGYNGEIDVIAFNYKENQLIHIEASMDANQNEKRVIGFNKKFRLTLGEYNELLKTEATNIKKIAIVGISKTAIDFGNGIQHITVPDFVNNITNRIKNIDPMKAAIPEGFPLMRAIQFSNYYINKTKDEIIVRQ